MSYQNINQYNFEKWYLLNRTEIQDFCLASDERDYNEEVIFSDKIIAINDGDRLPISFDLDNPNNSPLFVLKYNDYYFENNLISSNYYNPNKLDLSCFSATSICDIGLTGIDNGLVQNMTGETITVTNGLFPDNLKFERLYFDRRFKLHQVTGFTEQPNIRFSGLPKSIAYNIVSKQSDNIGVYHELYGGFYQGFYKLFGYDYEILPERMNKGWAVELLIKPRLKDEYITPTNQITLNEFYPNNKDIFFYFGTRAENKFYHNASGSPISDSGYTRVTENLTCIKTCACSNSAITTSNCIDVYQKNSINSGGTNPSSLCICDCKDYTQAEILGPDKNVELDSMSNAIAFKLCGDPKNPQIGVRLLRFTGTASEDGGCILTGSCESTGYTIQSGYTIENLCTPYGIYDFCKDITPEYLESEHWIMVDIVWERNTWLDECDLLYKGGLGLISKTVPIASLNFDSISLIQPPITHDSTLPEEVEIIDLNSKWLSELNYRLGKLKIYVNGRKFYTFENIEEIIPRGLNTEKEKQVGVPFNISWGGGTQGLHDNLTFTECPSSLFGLIYQQDPECLPNNILSATTLSALTTNILLEQNFAGSFDGAISQFRMYTIPLSSDEIKHNFEILKDKFELLDYECGDGGCYPPKPTKTPLPTQTPTQTPMPTSTPTQTPIPTSTPTPTPTPLPTQTPTPTPVPLMGYLFIEPISGGSKIGEWMYNKGSNFFGFSNESQPSQSQVTFDSDMNFYVDYSGWTNGELPSIIKQVIPQESGGVDMFDNPIVAYNFITTEISANTISSDSWYTWILPVELTNYEKQVEIDFNPSGNPNLLTPVLMEPTIYNLTFTYSGDTIPKTTYRVYTTFPNQIFKLNNNQNIYFRGNHVDP